MESEMELSRMMQESPASPQQSSSPAAQRDEWVRQLEKLKKGSGK